MSGKQKILLTLGLVHLGFVVLGASHVGAFRLGRWAGYYSQLTGSATGYGFFAPGVGPGLRAEFDIQEGITRRTVRLEPGLNRESDLRVGNLLNALSHRLEDETIRRSVSASLSARMFTRYPKAEQITLRLQTCDIARMEDYRAGQTETSWRHLYEATFVRSPQKKT